MTDFIIIGNANGAMYKNVFPLFKANKVRLGYSTVKTFNTKDGTKDFGNVGWFSTFPVKKKTLTLTSTYDPDKYPVYDNYPAINVDRVEDIPYDYDGVMGVPVSFLAKCGGGFVIEDKLNSPVIGGEKIYKRVIVKKKL